MPREVCLEEVGGPEGTCHHWREKGSQYPGFSYPPSSNPLPLPPIGHAHPEAAVSEPGIHPGTQGRTRGEEGLHLRQNRPSSQCSWRCLRYLLQSQLGGRAGLPGMSLGQASKGSSVCAFLGMGSIATTQFPSPLLRGPKSSAGSRPALKSPSGLDRAACDSCKDRSLSPLAALGLPGHSLSG